MPRSRVVWLLTGIFMPAPLKLGPITAVPFEVEEHGFEPAVRAYLARIGKSVVDGLPRATPGSPVVALEFPELDAVDADDAVRATQGVAEQVASAIAYRQYASPRLTSAMVFDLDNKELFLRGTIPHPPRVQHLPFTSEEREIGAILAAFQAHPQAQVLADLFAEASSERADDIAIVRLLGVLEALASEFEQQHNIDAQRAALRHLQIAEPQIAGQHLLTRANRIRKRFLHYGERANDAVAREVREELTSHVHFALRRSGMRPVDRSRTYE